MKVKKEIKESSKKLFIGETCLALCYALTVVAVVIRFFMGDVFNDAVSFVNADMSSAGLIYCSDIIQIVASIFVIVAYLSMSKKEPLFKYAMVFYIISIAISLSEEFLPFGIIVGSTLQAAKIIFASLSVIWGIKGLAKATDNKENLAVCKGAVTYLCLVSIILLVVSAIMEVVSHAVIISLFADTSILIIFSVICGVYAKTIKDIK